MFRILALSITFVLLSLQPVLAQDAILQTPAKQAFMVDYDTGTVLFQKNPDERMPTSSMSKTMTMFMVFDALKNGQIKLDDTFLVSENAWRKGGSKMFVEVDKRVSVENLIRGVIIQSGNDATIVLAEGLAGSEEAFAQAMNKKAAELGMKNTHFMNASGWPDPEHYSTARDLSILARHLINDFPDYYPYFAEKEFTYNSIKQGNRNPLLYRNMGVDGIKTGHTEDGGYGLMATGVQDGRRVILVVNGLENEQQRADESAKLLEWGFRGFQNRKLFAAGQSVEDAPIVLGQQKLMPLVSEKDIIVTVPHIAQDGIKAEVKYTSPLKAPVTKGTELGVLEVTIPGSELISFPLVAGADVAELGFMQAALAKLKILIGGSPS